MIGDLELGSWRLFNNIKANFISFTTSSLLTFINHFMYLLVYPTPLCLASSLLIKLRFRSCVKGSHRRRKLQRQTAFIGSTP
jgi:hypothetical protein